MAREIPVRLEFHDHSFRDVFARTCRVVGSMPHFECAPRGQSIKENLVQTLVLENPRDRLLNFDASPTNYGFAVGEFLWYWMGREDLESISYYNKRMPSFSDDGKTLNSAYGKRLRSNRCAVRLTLDGSADASNAPTQWEACVRTLLDDNDSRRAVMTINGPRDEAVAAVDGSKDVPCTLSLQFFIREEHLDLHVVMRSNDVFWGLKNDLFSFTLFQECMLLELQRAGLTRLRLGRYYHTAGSMHIYQRHFVEADRVWQEYEKDRGLRPAPMEPIDLAGLSRLAVEEEALRTRKVASIDEAQYSGGVRWMAEQLNAHRRKRDAERGRGQGRAVGPGDGPRAEGVAPGAGPG